MSRRVNHAGLQVSAELATFIEGEALPGTGIEPAAFWEGLAGLVRDFAPENAALLARRAGLQRQIDDWHLARRDRAHDAAAYASFLREIGYLVPEGPDFTVTTEGTDPEIASIAGPQLVVPITNARFALNAANARWGSLHDALYGTDAMGDAPAGGGFDPARAARVVAWARKHLDRVIPLAAGSWGDVTALAVNDGALSITTAAGDTALADPAQFAGWSDAECELQVLLRVHGLLIEIRVDRDTAVGGSDPAGIGEILIESALTSIMDCEDSVACVDGPDKAGAYRIWLGLMKGDLEVTFEKGGRIMTRRLVPATASYHAPGGGEIEVKRRALMLVRNVGHLMTTPAVLTSGGEEIPEGLLDALVTVLCAVHDLKGAGANSATSVYVVKPKMHGPEEVDFAVRIMDRVEEVLGLPRNTVKLGIMDEERRTSANLRECLRAASARVAFINTGFLDRTGDEIHTSMEAGPMLPKGEMKSQPWIAAYEARNVAIGLAAGLRGRAQIGKGMWAEPDNMAAMLEQKIGHPKAGANTAWVPSPTAATLHATHYHLVDVARVQEEMAANPPGAMLDELLTIPTAHGRNLTEDEITREIENNAQGILGYVVRWVDQGIGVSKVPDINDVGLMEDRATCRISSQGLANWLHHGVVSEEQVMAAMKRMAGVVDRQNAGDPNYRPMAPGHDGAAFNAACDLVFKGRSQPSGYTEPLLHGWRARVKAGA